LREEYDQFVERDAEILVIGPEGPYRFRQVWESQAYPFVGLSDHRHTVAKRYGQEVKLLKLGRMPALVIVDKQGVIRFTHFGDNMADIPPNSQVLTLLDRLNRKAEKK
jgi:peroxiredoxin Q/BCP